MTLKTKLVIRKKWLPSFVPPLLVLLTLTYLTLNLLIILPWVHQPFPGFLTFENGVVGTCNQFHWPATQVGLKPQDVVFSVNGEEVRHGQEIYAAAAAQPLGSFLTYGFSRGETLEELTLPVLLFTWRDFVSTALIPFLAGLALVLAGVGLFYWNPTDTGRWPLLFFHALMGNVLIGLVDFHCHYHFALLHLVLLTFLSATLLHFAMTFPEKQSLLAHNPWLGLVPYLFSILLSAPMLLYFNQADHWMLFQQVTLGYTACAYLAWLGFLVVTFKKPRFEVNRPIARALLISQGVLMGVTGGCALFLFFIDVTLPYNFIAPLKLFFPCSIFMALALVRLSQTQDQLLRVEGTASLGTLLFNASHHLSQCSAEHNWDKVQEFAEGLEAFRPSAETDQSIDLEKSIDHALTLLQARFGDALRIHKDYGHVPMIHGRAAEIRQLLFNIILNAMEAVAQQGEIWIRTHEGETFVEVLIKDSGRGISPKDQEKLFSPFFTTKAQAGSGLGLSLAQKIVERHKGKITVESKPNQGAQFTIRLPF